VPTKRASEPAGGEKSKLRVSIDDAAAEEAVDYWPRGHRRGKTVAGDQVGVRAENHGSPVVVRRTGIFPIPFPNEELERRAGEAPIRWLASESDALGFR